MKKMSEHVYQCEECGMLYANPDIAKECEEWCGKHHSCNTTIIKNAIQEE